MLDTSGLLRTIRGTMNEPAVRRNHAAPIAALGSSVTLRRAAGAGLFAVLTAAGAQVSVPLPGTPVPMTLQTLAVLLAGVVLGPGWGIASMLLYLLAGSVGYHVFALGRGEATVLLGPTGGYLVGFVLAQPVLGLLAARCVRLAGLKRRLALAATLLAGNATVFACGLAGLMIALGCTFRTAVAVGLLPFVPGLALKTAIATEIAARLSARAPGRAQR